MTTLVVGASGATGRLLVEQLLERGETVRVIVRPTAQLPEHLVDHANLSIVRAAVLELSDEELARQVAGCRAIASCLGHTLSWRGVYGSPRRLVTEAARRLCRAATGSRSEASAATAESPPTKFVLMNSAGVRNLAAQEQVELAQRCVIGLLRMVLPPHLDNEHAADYLRQQIGQHDTCIEWAVVRPDNLIDEEQVSEYEVHPSPIRSAIFNPGKTSRVNVAHFMAQLITDEETWRAWQGQMPVIYNRESK